MDRLIAAGSGKAKRWNETKPPRDRFALHHERAELVRQDLECLPDHPPVIAEGTVIPHPRVFLVHPTTPDHLERFFDLSGGVTTHAERIALIREANLDIANQVRAFYARGDAEGDPGKVVQRFACECGHPACGDFFEAPVAVMSRP
ncbi:hypothetical protein [Solirubrobacter soli]|uniref:hypothetical protein n=1 Tax=Solirubrobacter soli TaxID=363832 RepID=UPI001B7F9931|nr:hypothetical protein [Solirubrobacter soli]